MREMLNPRRWNVTLGMRFALNAGARDAHSIASEEIVFDATFGFDAEDHIREIFCKPSKVGTDLQSLLHHSFIAISVGLQHGASCAELARVLGEDDAKPPRSIIGAVLRTAAFIEEERRNTPPPAGVGQAVEPTSRGGNPDPFDPARDIPAFLRRAAQTGEAAP